MRVQSEDTCDSYRVSWYRSASRRTTAKDSWTDRKTVSSCRFQPLSSEIITASLTLQLPGGVKTHLLRGVFCRQVHTPGVQELEHSSHQPFTVGVYARGPAPGRAAIAAAAVGTDKGSICKGVGVRVILGSGEQRNSMAGEAAQRRTRCSCAVARTAQ